MKIRLEIGNSKFASLRPRHVVPVSDKDQNVCCCKYHENADMQLDGIRKFVPAVTKLIDLVTKTACGWQSSCYLDNCDQWPRIIDVISEIVGNTDKDQPC